jgi:hypothetical protein
MGAETDIFDSHLIDLGCESLIGKMDPLIHYGDDALFILNQELYIKYLF